MKINDVIYGEFEITEPVLLELLEAPSVIRLKKINQFAIPGNYHEINSYSRYEHSVGVMLLLRHLGADLEEQVTGLLHDISHTAFSHLVDMVVSTGSLEEDYQDKRHVLVIAKSEIPSILLKHGLNVGRVSSHKADSLLEKDLPELCADRVDYGLREIYHVIDKTIPTQLFNNLTAVGSNMVFKNRESARLFADMFLDRQKNHWGHPRFMLRWHIFSVMMKSAIKKEIITLEDFDLTDDIVMNKLILSKDPEVEDTLKILQKPLIYELANTNPTIVLKKKFRYVDPYYLNNGKLERLSETDPEFKEEMELARQINNHGFGVTYKA